MQRITLILVCFLGFFTTPMRADILYLKDGRILNGPTMEKEDDGVRVRFENGTVFVPEALILEAVIAGDSGFVPRDEYEKSQVEKGLTLFQGRWLSPARRDREINKYMEKRRAAIAEEETYRIWRNRRKEKTKHFEFEYTVPQHIFEHYRDLMETYYSAFAKQWKVRRPKSLGARLKVCFYIDRETFTQVGGAPRGAAGYFRHVPPLELNFYYDRFDPVFTEAVMYHETNHYLTKLLNVDLSFPHFPGESLAEYYGASHYDPQTGRLTSGLVQEGRLTSIKTDLAAGKPMTLEKLVATDQLYEHYTWGWSLVHFLMNDSRYQKKFQKFVIALGKDRDVDRVETMNQEIIRGPEVYRVFRKCLGLKKDADVQDLEKEWLAYVREKLELVSPRGKEIAAADAMSSYPGRPIRARRLYKEAIDEGSTNPQAFHKYAKLLTDDNQHEEARRMWNRAIELDPLNPQFYAKLGANLARHGNEAEGVKFMKLAMEIDPEYAWSLEEILNDLLEKVEQ